MALAAASATLGAQLAAAAGSPDAIGVSAWTAIGGVIASTLPSCCSVFNPLFGTPMASAAGGVINAGSGRLITTTAAPLGIALAAASMSVDAVGIVKWMAVADALVNWMGKHASYGSGLIGFTGVGTGAVTGVGKVQFADENIGPALAEAAGSTDAEGIARWSAIGAVIIVAVKTYGQIMPTSLQNPGPSGPVSGTGTFI